MRAATTLIVLGILTSLVIAMEPGKKLPPAPKDAGDNAGWLRFIAARKQTMTRVTDQPISMDYQVSVLCRLPLPTDLPEANPHRGHDVHVYVTPGEEQKIRTGEGTYPVGTLIVKEKLPSRLEIYSDRILKIDTKPENVPELFTVMLKREAGYHKECGDWEFMVVSGDVKQILARGKLDSCVECHKDHQETDYVTQLYPVPKEEKKKKKK